MDIISFPVNVLLRFITANAFTHRRSERIAIKSLISIYIHPRRHHQYCQAKPRLWSSYFEGQSAPNRRSFNYFSVPVSSEWRLYQSLEIDVVVGGIVLQTLHFHIDNKSSTCPTNISRATVNHRSTDSESWGWLLILRIHEVIASQVYR